MADGSRELTGELAAQWLADAASPARPHAAVHSPRGLLKSYQELGKVRLSGMVVVTTALGYFVASRQVAALDLGRMAWTCLGTFLAAIGASAFNQAIEGRRDGRMLRTHTRPIPAGDLSVMHACYFGLLACIAGVAILCPTSNGLTAILATANILLYVLIYTPMKTISSANTLVGAVVGAIPPMMGWAAVTGHLEAGAWVLGAILFIWQIPHFLALAWMYKDDYLRGGYKMVSTVEPTGRLTALLAVLYALALIPTAALLTLLGYAGWAFAIISLLLGAGLVVLAARFAKTRSRADARRLFLATIVYLPVLSMVLVCDTRSPFDGLEKARAAWVRPSAEKFVDPGAPVTR